MSNNEWHIVKEADRERIHCQNVYAGATCNKSAVACLHLGGSFFYHCEEHAKERGFEGLRDYQEADSGKLHNGWYKTFDHGSKDKVSIEFRMFPADRFTVSGTREQMAQLRDHLSLLVGPDADAEEEECTCAERSWYGPEHDTACPFAGQPRDAEAEVEGDE